jgi:hypothetical protein
MNRAIHASAAQQRTICRIYDGVYVLLRDIALDNHN